MKFADVLSELPSLTLAERQHLIRSALVLDEPDLSPEESQLVENRLAAHRADPRTAIGLDEITLSLRTWTQG